MLDKTALKELKMLIALCKKEGVKSVECSGIKIEFNQYALPERKIRRKKLDQDSEPTVEMPYSDEDVLMWSAMGHVNG
jgi:hypothetical protein